MIYRRAKHESGHDVSGGVDIVGIAVVVAIAEGSEVGVAIVVAIWHAVGAAICRKN